jgi:hypothetical protein
LQPAFPYILAELMLGPDDFGIWPAGAASLLGNPRSLTNLKMLTRQARKFSLA